MLLALLFAALPQTTPSDPPPTIVLRELLAIERLGERSRSPVYTDALEARLARGTWRAPAEGDAWAAAGGEERTWKRFEADAEGWFSGAPFRGGWAFVAVDVPASGPWRLDASGHSDVLVDGEPHAGDVYGLGLTRVPLHLEAGRHELLFRCGRGRLRATLAPAPGALYLEEVDRTLPDVVRGEDEPLWLGTIVANAGPAPVRGLRLAVRAGGRARTTEVPLLLASSFAKCAAALEVPAELPGETLEVHLALQDEGGRTLDETTLSLAVRAPDALHVRTFRSAIDGSVQYYAVVPPARPVEHPRLVLSLHGAGVEGRGQAACYRPREGTVIVAPTNRRPFGFDWEDWGRMDALEVLELARARTGADPRRTLLTGHSMGGHGTWQLGAHFPGLFAAIAPSAGWRDFWGYAGAGVFDEADPVGPLLARAANASRTGLLERNYAGLGIYVLHGDADDNVPVGEARAMRAALAAFHSDFAYYERPGAGHWWGNECVDWPPLMDFLERHAQAERPLAIDFTTVDPSVSSTDRWISIHAAGRVLLPARVVARMEPEQRLLTLELDNVAVLGVDLSPFDELRGGGPLRVRVGEQELQLDPAPFLRLACGPDGAVALAGPPDPGRKSDRRAGPFKAGFRHRFLLVPGTRGTPAESAWALAKARYDHEQWRYRGNGAVDVVLDVDFRPEEHRDRDVILYGNRDSNAAWPALLDSAAFELGRGVLRVDERRLEGEDLALLALHPRRDSDVASVVVIGGSGLPGARTTTFLPYFVSGVGYPDWTVLGTEFLEQGLSGVRGAGYFGADWGADAGAEAGWR